jgi:hydroxymethylpyrimidine kinase/phosphomethylpyrimidine kinase
MAHHPPRVLTIAGSDSSGAAGAQADLKTFEARGVYGTSALTLVTAQDSRAITDIRIFEPAFIAAQIDAVLADLGADAIKTGMLLKAPIITLVAAKAAQYGISALVVDPVLVAGDGRRLVDADGENAYKTALFPQAQVITPNTLEAAILTGRPIATLDDMRAAAALLHAMGPRFVLIKGGHVPDSDLNPHTVVDLLYDGAQGQFIELPTPRLPAVNVRGTGCTFASCIAAEIAKGAATVDAVITAQAYVAGALRAAIGWQVGAGRGTVDHGWERRGSHP